MRIRNFHNTTFICQPVLHLEHTNTVTLLVPQGGLPTLHVRAQVHFIQRLQGAMQVQGALCVVNPTTDALVQVYRFGELLRLFVTQPPPLRVAVIRTKPTCRPWRFRIPLLFHPLQALVAAHTQFNQGPAMLYPRFATFLHPLNLVHADADPSGATNFLGLSALPADQLLGLPSDRANLEVHRASTHQNAAVTILVLSKERRIATPVSGYSSLQIH